LQKAFFTFAVISNFAEIKCMRCILALLVAFITSCNSHAQSHKSVSADAFEAGMNTEPGITQILDVRTAGEFKKHSRQIGIIFLNFSNGYRHWIKRSHCMCTV
jgi:hypothetical protein